VVGTSPEGVFQAANALTTAVLRSRLRGNFVLVNDQSLSVADTRTGLGLASVTDAGNASAQIPITSPEEEAQPETAPAVFEGGNVSWIPTAVGGLLVVILVVLILAALTRRRTVAQ